MTTKKKKTTKKKPPKVDPVLDGFHQELKRIVHSDEPLTPAKLNLIGQLVQSAQSILRIRDPRLQACGMGMGVIGGGWAPNLNPVPSGSSMAALEDDEEDTENPADEAPPPPTYTGPAPRMGMDRETFGAKVLRELVSLVPHLAKTMREDPAQLVQAIAAAKAEGMDEIAAQLEARLLGPTNPSLQAVADAPGPTGGSVISMSAKKTSKKKTAKKRTKKKTTQKK